jgi:glycosyltransferase involved in cell wall biosynthesis
MIKILHIFAPSFTSRFSGQNIWWKNVFGHWNTVDAVHYVLDYEKSQLDDSREAFDFEYSDVQKGTSKWERATWVFTLFRNLIKHERKYDILHVHVLWWGGLLIGPWARCKKIPALYESVLLDADTPGAVLKEGFGKLKVRCLKSYKAILAISEYLAEDYRKCGFSTGQVFTLVNCVDDKLFYPVTFVEEKLSIRQKMNLPADAIVLVFVGSVIERKGVDVLIQAFIEASSKHPDLYLVIVGPKTKNENPSLDENFINGQYDLLKQNNLSGRATFTGLIQEREKLAQLYRASDMFVFPSRQEGLGNVVLEAMASGLPVAVSQLPVLDKIIQHEENGLYVPIGDAGALTDAILRLCSDAALARKIGQNARTYVEKNHGFEAWQAHLVEIYRNLIV